MNRSTDIDRFFGKISADAGTGCWLWTGKISGGAGRRMKTIDPNKDYGYPRLKIAGKWVQAMRFAYESLIGPIPHGKVLHRTCGRRRCVNPNHALPRSHKGKTRQFYVTQKTCAHGHPITDRYSKSSHSWRGYCRICNIESARQYRGRKRNTASE